MRILLCDLDWNAHRVLEHSRDLTIVALICLDTDNLSVFEINGEKVLVMGHQANDKADS